MSRYLIVVDMQNDFITGPLGTPQARDIVTVVTEKAANFPGVVIFTRDTHGSDYLTSREGKKLPVEHCLKNTPGWQLCPELHQVCRERKAKIVDKPTFGSVELGEYLRCRHRSQAIDSIELVGLCTDICLISNALLLKAFLPEVTILVDASCCAGVTPHSHRTALEAMKACQIEVKNYDEEI